MLEFEEITEGEELPKRESRAAWDIARQTERSPLGAGVEGRRLHQPKGELSRAGGRLCCGAFDYFAPGSDRLRPTLRVACLTQPRAEFGSRSAWRKWVWDDFNTRNLS